MPKKIMVVDDEDFMIDFIRTGLEIEGYDVISTSNALQAIELAHQNKPDLIILDFMMPGIDGYSIYKGLSASQITKYIPVIFVTGNLTPEVRAKIFQTKAFCFLPKPFEITELTNKVKEALSILPV